MLDAIGMTHGNQGQHAIVLGEPQCRAHVLTDLIDRLHVTKDDLRHAGGAGGTKHQCGPTMNLTKSLFRTGMKVDDIQLEHRGMFEGADVARVANEHCGGDGLGEFPKLMDGGGCRDRKHGQAGLEGGKQGDWKVRAVSEAEKDGASGWNHLLQNGRSMIGSPLELGIRRDLISTRLVADVPQSGVLGNRFRMSRDPFEPQHSVTAQETHSANFISFSPSSLV